MKKEQIPDQIKSFLSGLSNVYTIVDLKPFYETQVEDGELVKKFVSHQISYRTTNGIRVDAVIRLEK